MPVETRFDPASRSGYAADCKSLHQCCFSALFLKLVAGYPPRLRWLGARVQKNSVVLTFAKG